MQPTIQSSSISFDTNDRYFFATSFATFSRNQKGLLLLLLFALVGDCYFCYFQMVESIVFP
jgi:hypothetical protein